LRLRPPREVVVKVSIIVVWTVVGLVAGMLGIGEFFGIPAMEGRAGMFGLFFGAPVGAIAGFFTGWWLAHRYRDNLRMQERVLGGTVAGAVAIVASAFLFETIRTYDRLDSYGNSYGLSFQVRLLPDASSPAGATVGVQLFSSKENPQCDVYDYPHGLTREGERWLVSGQCNIYFATSKRTLGVRMGGGPTHVFKMRVRAFPTSATYSEWFPVDEINDNATGQMRPPRPEEMIEIRYGAR
jgi:hypothetical protein